MAESVEYEVLICHTVDLQLAVRENLTPLGAQLVSAKIITLDQYREIRNAQRPVNERGADLVGYVQTKVCQDPQQYHVFIGALKKDLSQYGSILTKLEQTRLSVASEWQPVLQQLPPLRGGGNRLPAQVMKARFEAEGQTSDKFENIISQLHQGLRHLQQELAHYMRQHEDSIQQQYESEQGQVYISEFEQLQLKLAQCERERWSYLHEIKRLREDLARTQRERREALEERDRSIRQKDSQICDLQRQLREADSDVQEHSTTTTQILISLGDGWNVPRDEIKLFPDREIGRGASGVVVEGCYQNRMVAVKQIHQSILQNSTVVEEFRREIGIMASVKHPNLVLFVAAVFDDAVLNLEETPLLVSELLNTNLRKAYERGTVESQYLRHSILRDVAYGLHYLHEHREPIIHRDISSSNILLEALSGGMWRAKLCDFGSANFLKRAKTLGVGAIVYIAPEIFPRHDPNAPMPRTTTKCDVFSYGIVLVEVITKIMPSQENRHQLFEEARVKWPLMHELASRCAEVAPEARPTMSEVLNTLNRIPIARPRV